MKREIQMKSSTEVKNRVDFLNIYRFVAFLMVFCLHAKSFAPTGWNNSSLSWLIYTPAWAGVWIFFVLSGYGIGYGFLFQRYPIVEIKDVFKFWWGRFKKIAPMYYLYLMFAMFFVAPAILTPDKANVLLILKLLVFWYTPEADSFNLGIVWYLCTLIKLYFIAPFFWLIFRNIIHSKKEAFIAIIILIVVGFRARTFVKSIIESTGSGAWHIDIYKPFYMNLDLFFSGFLLAYWHTKGPKTEETKEPKTEEAKEPKVPKSLKRTICKLCTVLMMIALLLYNNYIYYCANILGALMDAEQRQNYWFIYQYILPTAWLVVSLLIIKVWDVDREYQLEKISGKALMKNPIRIFDYFPLVMMTSYLFHANFLRVVGSVLQPKTINKIFSNRFDIHISKDTLPLVTHICDMIVAIICTFIFAWILSCINRKEVKR